ncbi:MAG: MBL fold metallo-hydrolase [Gemmataceae bacterium]|nr:MBL fold metallo-hydrolase [Gemmataceae bacterium]
MPARFCVLASGSSGNCAFLQVNGFGLLIDIGLGPRFVASRLATIGASWRDVHAAVLTHTHSDHWKDATLAHLKQMRLPLYCSPRHHEDLKKYGGRFTALLQEGLVRSFEANIPFDLPAGIQITPISVPHDAEPTFAFRLNGPPGLFGPQWSLGYASDLGEAREDLLTAFQGVSVLALEFNHCEHLERMSLRPKFLIDRVLGPLGHLSNDQASQAVQSIVQASDRGALRHLVQLHLSQDCNRPTLAAQHGKDVLAELGSSAKVITAQQFATSDVIPLEGDFARSRPIAVQPSA